MFYVYVLFREDGETPFYVGKGSGDRWAQHERYAKRGRSHKDSIIAGMADRGIAVPKVKIAEGLTEDAALALEIETIAAIGRRCNGGPLVNHSDGGDGRRNPDPEARERLRVKMASPDQIAARAAFTMAGRTHSEETREKMRAAAAGRRMSDASREKMRTAKLGVKAAESTRSKMAATHRERWARIKAGG